MARIPLRCARVDFERERIPELVIGALCGGDGRGDAGEARRAVEMVFVRWGVVYLGGDAGAVAGAGVAGGVVR